MKNITLTLLAAAAIGAISIGSASAMPFNSASPAFGPSEVQSDVQKVRVVCNSRGHCYNTRRRVYRGSYAYAPGYYPGYYNGGYGYYGGPAYGYYGGPRVGIGIGPFGFGIW
jgi:hypothetical protein